MKRIVMVVLLVLFLAPSIKAEPFHGCIVPFVSVRQGIAHVYLNCKWANAPVGWYQINTPAMSVALTAIATEKEVDVEMNGDLLETITITGVTVWALPNRGTKR